MVKMHRSNPARRQNMAPDLLAGFLLASNTARLQLDQEKSEGHHE